MPKVLYLTTMGKALCCHSMGYNVKNNETPALEKENETKAQTFIALSSVF